MSITRELVEEIIALLVTHDSFHNIHNQSMDEAIHSTNGCLPVQEVSVQCRESIKNQLCALDARSLIELYTMIYMVNPESCVKLRPGNIFEMVVNSMIQGNNLSDLNEKMRIVSDIIRIVPLAEYLKQAQRMIWGSNNVMD
jgi:hypothetical protein